MSKRDKVLQLEQWKDYCGCDREAEGFERAVRRKIKQKAALDAHQRELYATKRDEQGRIPIEQTLSRLPCGSCYGRGIQ